MRIAALSQLQQQFIQVKAAHEPLIREVGRQAVDLRRHQLTCLRITGPRHEQPLKGTQYSSQGRFGPIGAAREQGEPSVFAAEDFDDPARVSVRKLVQYIGRGQPYAPRASHSVSNPNCRNAISLSAQFSLTLTHSSRCTERCHRSLSSMRASRPISFRRSPPCPMTMAFCPARSTQITALIMMRLFSSAKRSICTLMP